MVPAVRPLRADARRNRERIVEAASAEYAASGGQLQMDAVAARAGLGVGTLYRHFPTKEAMVAELMRLRFEELAQEARAALEVADPWAALAGYMTAATTACADEPGTQHLFFSGDPAGGPRYAAETGLNDLVQQLVDRCHEAGVLRPDLSATDVGMLLCGLAAAMHFGPAWHWRRHLDVVLDGVRAPAGPSSR